MGNSWADSRTLLGEGAQTSLHDCPPDLCLLRKHEQQETWWRNPKTGNQIALVCYCFLFVPDLERTIFLENGK